MVAMLARERLLMALDGEAPDRPPLALAFFRVDGTSIAPPGEWRGEDVDVEFVAFPVSEAEAELRRRALPHEADSRLGSASQIARYATWGYHPETPRPVNPLELATSLADLEAFDFPQVSGPRVLDGLRSQVDDIHARGLAAGGNTPHLGGEMFEAAWRLRGLDDFLVDLLERKEMAAYLLDRLAELAVSNAATLALAGIDVLSLDDDVGMPGTMLIGPHTWREFLKPRLVRVIEAARAVRPELRIIYHSDGHFEPILDDLVEIGIDGINPLQPEHMDAVSIRRRFGPRLALWGTVGTQTAFAFGTPGSIRDEVHTRVRELGRAGLVLCPAYDIDEPDIPWANIRAFLDAGRTA